MQKKERIEKILKGKTVRIFSALADDETVSFVETFRNCGKKSCVRCRQKGSRPHGPYWNLNYPGENGKTKTLYVGRKLPEIAQQHAKLSFADVVRFYTESEHNKESISRYQKRISVLKQELDRVYEELRVLQRFTRRDKISPKAERFFRNLVFKYHPDRASDHVFAAEDVMKDINQLYQLVKA